MREINTPRFDKNRKTAGKEATAEKKPGIQYTVEKEFTLENIHDYI